MTPRVVGHRGAPRVHRENTLEGFRSAAALGASMVELDVRRTADDVLVVHHDPVVKGVGVIIELSADRLPSYIPTLDAALSASVGVGMDVNIEVKNDRSEPDFDQACRLADDVVALLAARGDGARMLISSFHPATLERVRALDSTLATALLFSLPVPGISTLLRRCCDAGHVAVHPWWRSCTRALIDQAHDLGLLVNTWTVNDPARMRILADRGVDGIVTDVPDLARSVCG